MMASDLRMRAEKIFNLVVDLPAEQREAELHAQAAGDSDVMREVRCLLSAIDGQMGDFLERPALDRADIPGNPLRVGAYEVVGILGEGGMGVVYEARQENPRRTVALKLIRPGIVSQHLLRRFEHEAQILGQLQHPGIAQIYEAGSGDVFYADAKGHTPPVRQSFFAMEFVRGHPLNRYADACQLGTRERLELFTYVCDAVHYAHTRGVIHRDIKPGNIVVDENAQPRILDFGVARATESDIQTTTLNTAVGQLVGTLPYMSPEQVSGDQTRIDHRTDIYALGVTLYELLVGRLPFDLRNRSIPEAARIIREDEPTRLSSLNAQLRGDIDTIVSKAIEKEQARRYESVAALASDIRRYLRDEPIQARPASTWYQFQKFSRRNRGWVVGFATAILILVAGATVAFSLAVYASRQRDVAEQRSTELASQAYRAGIAAASSALQNGDIRLAQVHLGAAPRELRGWEWEYLNCISNRSLLTFESRAGWIQRIATINGDRQVLTINSEGGVSIWDLGSGRKVEHFNVPVSKSLNLTGVSPSGTCILLAQVETHEFVNWNLRDGRPLWRHPASVVANGDYSKDETRIALPGNQSVTIVDASSGAKLASVETAVPAIGATFGPGNGLIQVLLQSGCTRLVDLAKAGTRFELCVWSVVVDPTWTQCVYRDDNVRAWKLLSIPDGKLLAEMPETDSVGRNLYLGDSNSSVLSLDNAGSIATYDGQLRPITRIFGPPDAASVALTRDGSRLVTATRDGVIQLWDAHAVEAPYHILAARGETSVSAAIDAAGESTYVGGWGDVQSYDARTGRLRWRRFLSRRFIVALAPDSSGARLACIDLSGHVMILDAHTGDLIERAQPLKEAAFAMCWMKSNNRILAGHRDGSLAIIEKADSPARYVPGHACAIHCMALSKDEQRLATGSGLGAENSNFASNIGTDDNSVIIWDTQNWSPLHRLVGHSRPVVAVAFHPNDGVLASAGMDGALMVWNAQSGARLKVQENVGVSRALAFSPDGKRLAAICSDGAVHVWETERFDELLMLRTPGLGSLAASFAENGRTLIACGREGLLALETDNSRANPERFDQLWALRLCDRNRSSLVEDSIAGVKADKLVPDSVRAEAIRYLQTLGDHANVLNSEAIIETQRTENVPQSLASARRKIEAALRVLPEDEGYLSTYGAILYKQGEYESALKALNTSNNGRAAAHMPEIIENWALLAMAHFRLGNKSEASKAADHFRRSMQATEAKQDSELRSLRAEVDALIAPDSQE